jgi:hypothetical protein
MASNDPRFPAVKINLVEDKRWKSYDPAESDWAQDAAWEDFSNMKAEDFYELIQDLSFKKNEKGKPPRRNLTSEEIEWLAKQVKRSSKLEETKQAITDALGWMYEEAAMPSDGDIKDALELAKGTVAMEFDLGEDLWAPVIELESERRWPQAPQRRGPKEWRPPRKAGEKAVIRMVIEELMTRVDYDRKEGWYDRYLVFDFRGAQAVHNLLSRSEWTAEQIVPRLQEEFKGLMNDVVANTFFFLKKIMDDIDVSNRTDWRKAWKSMLSSGIATSVQKEMYAALKEMPDA